MPIIVSFIIYYQLSQVFRTPYKQPLRCRSMSTMLVAVTSSPPVPVPTSGLF
jgi:hypothetical protein